MKKIIHLAFIWCLLSTVMMTSCETDGTEEGGSGGSSGEGAVAIGDVTFDLVRGYIARKGKDETEFEGFQMRLVLLSDGLKIVENDEWSDGEPDADGTGDGIIIELYSDYGSDLAEGTYTFDNSSDINPVNTFGEAAFYCNVSTDSDPEADYLLKDGTIVVSKNEDAYTIEIDGTTSDDETVACTYSGTLNFYKGDGIETNYISIQDSIDYSLSNNAVLQYLGPAIYNEDGVYMDNDYSNFGLTLYSEGITVTTNEDGEPELTGKGNCIYLEMISESKTDLLVDDWGANYYAYADLFDYYDWSDNEEEYFGPSIITKALFYKNYDPETGEYDEINYFYYIDLSISKDGDTYFMEASDNTTIIDKIDADDNAEPVDLTFYFTGTLSYYDSSLSGNFEVNDSSYQVTQGIIIIEGEDESDGSDQPTNGSYKMDLILTSDNITVETDENGAYTGINGQGDAIYLEIISSSENDIDEGDYWFDSDEYYSAGSFINTKYFIDYDSDSSESTDGVDFISGRISVTKEDDTYTIKIYGKDEDDNVITGYYIGTLDFQ